MTFRLRLITALAIFLSLSAHSKIKVIVTVPDYKEVFESIGKDKVVVQSLLDGREDPHYIDAVPSFITKVAKADIVCAVGLELEIGWLPKVLSKSANPKVQSGGKGYCELGQSIDVIEKQVGPVDRSMGDVHAGGNPHFNLSPTKLKEVARKAAKILSEHAPQEESFFNAHLNAFHLKMDRIKAEVSQKLVPIKNMKLIQFHKEFSYYLLEYGLNSFGAIEEKPGVPPSSARISSVSLNSKKANVGLAIGSFHTPVNYLKKFTEISGIPHVKIPASSQVRDEKLDSIEEVQHHIADEILNSFQIDGASGLAR